MRQTDSHSLPKAGGQPYCLYLQGLNTSLCNRSLILSFIRRSETFHRFLAIATWFYSSSIGWRQYIYKTMAYIHVTYRPDLWRPSAEKDISWVHRQSVINQKRFVIRKPTCRILTGSHGRAITWRRHFRHERPLAPEMILQPFPLNINRK
jgi:hypothetical protein